MEEAKAIQENTRLSKQVKREKFLEVNQKILAIQNLPERELEMKIEALDWQKIAETV